MVLTGITPWLATSVLETKHCEHYLSRFHVRCGSFPFGFHVSHGKRQPCFLSVSNSFPLVSSFHTYMRETRNESGRSADLAPSIRGSSRGAMRRSTLPLLPELISIPAPHFRAPRLTPKPTATPKMATPTRPRRRRLSARSGVRSSMVPVGAMADLIPVNRRGGHGATQCAPG
jgi:hypothetical protein